jgi:hypothetical protein
MTKTLDPDLLAACAHYLLHVDAYALAEDVGELLRPQAVRALVATANDSTMIIPQECDRFVEAHFSAIARYSNTLPHVPMPHLAVCRVIVEAPQPQREWWARRLADSIEPAHLPVVGRPGERDPENPCADFDPGTPSGECETDGHYLCAECRHCERCPGGCGQTNARCECPTCDTCSSPVDECTCAPVE